MTRSLLLFVTLLSSLPAILYGQEGEQEDLYAIVVGISKYHYIRPLSYADRDADLFASYLRSAAGGRIKEENLFLLKNDSANAGNFWSTLHRLSNKNLKKGDRVYIFFAGHGDAVKGLNEYYLLLSDCQPANDGNNYLLSFGVIDMYHLKNRIGVLVNKGADVVLVLDACRTNELAGGYASQVFNSSIIQTKVGEIAMLATGPGQVSIEDISFGQGHGLFTYNLVDALSGRADHEETGNRDQKISLKEIQTWVGSNVNLMSAKFNVKQNPVFCCDDKVNTTIGIVDSSFSMAWNQLKQLNNTIPSGPAGKTQRNNNIVADSALLALYNHFNEARNKNNLWGKGSADDYFDQMRSGFPNEKLTEEARYALAAGFINFAQQKINLYLEGVDLLSLEILREKSDSLSHDEFLSEEYERIKKTVSEKWTIAGLMLQKAGKLLSSNQDSSVLLQMRPKINFLFARGFLSDEDENTLDYYHAMKIALEAYRTDSSAAYTAECLGLLYAERLDLKYRDNEFEFHEGSVKRADTSLYYFTKAATLAPKWVNPYRSIALKIYGYVSKETGLSYLRRAMAINPANPTTYLLVAEFLRAYWRHADSIVYYYRIAAALSPGSALPEIYTRMGRAFFWYPKGKTFGSIKDSILWYTNKALSIDSAYTEAYRNLTRLYENEKKMDSIVFLDKKIMRSLPGNTYPYYGLINTFKELNKHDSVFRYSKLLLDLDPSNSFAIHHIARYYDDRKMNDSAILYYQKNIRPDFTNVYNYERLAYLLMEKNKNDTLPLDYFLKILQREESGSWRPYYNIACYYSNQGNLDKAIEFLEKALARKLRNYNQIYSDPYLAYIRDKEPFLQLMKKYFPGNK